MGKVKYMTLKYNDAGMPMLVAEKASEKFDLRCSLDSPSKIMDVVFGFDWGDFPEEHVYCIAMTKQNRPIALFDVAHGGYDSCCVDMKPLFTRLLLSGCTGFVLLHNHPSGDPSPSQADMILTQNVKNAADMLNIELLDHIIIGHHAGWMGDKYVSFRERGMLK